MAIKIPLPPSREFHFKLEDDRLARVAGDEPFDAWIKFRQATQEQEGLRSQLMTTSQRYIWRDREMEAKSFVDPLDQMRYEVELTLAGTDIQHEDGKGLKFESEKVDREDFVRWWQALPGVWGQEIYRACLETNPNWVYKSA